MTTTISASAPVGQTAVTPGRLGGATGIAFVVLALVGNSLTGGGVDTDASSDAYAAEVARRTADGAWRAGVALELVAFLALLVFVAALARRIRLSEPREGYLGLAVLAAGTLLVAVKLASGSALYAADRRSGALDGELARLLSDLNDASFALSFVPLGLLLGAAAEDVHEVEQVGVDTGATVPDGGVAWLCPRSGGSTSERGAVRPRRPAVPAAAR